MKQNLFGKALPETTSVWSENIAQLLKLIFMPKNRILTFLFDLYESHRHLFFFPKLLKIIFF